MSDNNHQNGDNPEDEIPADVISSTGPGAVDSSGEIRISPSGGFPAVKPLGAKKAAPNVRAVLHIKYGPESGEYPVSKTPFQFGRGRGHLQLRDPFVDPWHAQLSGPPGHLVLDDLGSTNGVFLAIADELSLEDGDEVAIGNQRLRFKTSLPATTTRKTPLAGGDPPVRAPRIEVLFQSDEPTYSVPVTGAVLIGGQNADLSFEGDPLVSAVHASIEPSGDGFVLKDLQSETKTFIRIHDPMELISGDTFLLGRTAIEIRYP